MLATAGNNDNNVALTKLHLGPEGGKVANTWLPRRHGFALLLKPMANMEYLVARHFILLSPSVKGNESICRY